MAGHPISYLNASAFQRLNNAPYTFGNIPRNGVYGLRSPFTWDQDLTVRRTFSVWENLKLQAAVSAFNIYNSVNFGGVGVVLDSASFGTVSNQANQPRKLQAEARTPFRTVLLLLAPGDRIRVPLSWEEAVLVTEPGIHLQENGSRANLLML